MLVIEYNEVKIQFRDFDFFISYFLGLCFARVQFRYYNFDLFYYFQIGIGIKLRSCGNKLFIL